MRHVCTFANDSTYHFVTTNEWVLADAPVIVLHAEIAMAKAAGFDSDVDFIISKFAQLEAEWLKGSTSRKRSLHVNVHRD
jgi:hypothetical protein